jgi:DNA-binding CsgD family transcriptional regulator
VAQLPIARAGVRSAADPLTLVEAAYELGGDEDGWLGAIRKATIAVAPAMVVRASLSLVYDGPSAATFRVDRVNAEGIDGPSAVAALQEDVAKDPAYVQDSFLSRTCDWIGNVPRTEQQEGWKAVRSALGVVDGFVVNGLDAAGLGVVSLLLVANRPVVSDRVRATMSHVAAHVVAGLRIRRRLASSEDRLADADAVLSPNGDFAHAVRSARLPESRESLRRAARALDRARGRLRRDDSERAVGAWKVLVENRWSLLDHFERDGRRYLLACRNAPSAPAGVVLTPRERQVVLLAARGHSNKLIGYELGIAASTVGVLLGRAAVRLGVKSRRALIDACSSRAPRVRRQGAPAS